MTSSGFASRAQAVGDRNANAATSAGQGTQTSSGGQVATGGGGNGGGSTGGERTGVVYTGFARVDPEASQKK